MSGMMRFRISAIQVNFGYLSQMLVGLCLGLCLAENQMEDLTLLQLLQISGAKSNKCWFCNPAGANLSHMF